MNTVGYCAAPNNEDLEGGEARQKQRRLYLIHIADTHTHTSQRGVDIIACKLERGETESPEAL